MPYTAKDYPGTARPDYPDETGQTSNDAVTRMGSPDGWFRPEASAAAGDRGTAKGGLAEDDFATLVFLRIEDDFATLQFPRVEEGASPGALVPRGGSVGVVPVLAAGVELVGEYQGSGLTDVTFLARNASGQVVHLSRLLWLVLSGVDGSRTLGEIAARVSVEFGRTVSAGNVEYLLVNKLFPAGLVAGEEGAAQTPAGAPGTPILALRMRGTLIPQGPVQVIARLFGPLFSPPVVVVVLALLVAADVWLLRSGGLLAAFRQVLSQPLLLLIVLGLSVVSMVFHECGHAAACRYGGARPGRIGVGLYVLWPALFTNVTDSYRLGRIGRLRTDLGGVYFNAVFAVVLAGAYLETGYRPLAAAVLVVQVELAQQLLPSLRVDGYFILTDLVGVPDLFRQIGPVLRSLVPGQPADPRVGVLRRGSRIALSVWVVVIVPLLGGELVLLLLGIPTLAKVFARTMATDSGVIAAEFGHGQVAAGLVGVISVLLLAFPAVGVCYILILTGRAAFRAAMAATRRRRVLRIPLAAVALVAAAGLGVSWGLLPLPGHHAAVTAPVPAASGASRPSPVLFEGRPIWQPSAVASRVPSHRRHHHRSRPEPAVSRTPAYAPAPASPSPSPKPSKSPKASKSPKPSPSPSPSATPSPAPSYVQPIPSASASG